MSILTIPRTSSSYSGIYTCEAFANDRSMGPDYSLTVTTYGGQVCMPPFFNNEALTKEDCFLCYCSNVSSKCSSVKNYVVARNPKLSAIQPKLFKIMHIDSEKVLEISPYEYIYDHQSDDYIVREKLFEDIRNDGLFLRGTFGLNGSWITSYGQLLSVDIVIAASNFSFAYRGPYLAIYGSNKKAMFWCPLDSTSTVYYSVTGYRNQLYFKLYPDKNYWYENSGCKQPVDRIYMLSILRNVDSVALRIKYFPTQTRWEASRLRLSYIEAAPSTGMNFIAEIEQCECPVGYSGLSCEVCAGGYTRGENGQCKPCPCPNCDSNGKCPFMCEGNRAGPNCHHCKPGTYRPAAKIINADCELCPCAVSLPGRTIRNCAVDPLGVPADHVCQCKEGSVVIPECRNCTIESQKENQCPKPNEERGCSSYGTTEISNGMCQCHANYEGYLCKSCVETAFPVQERCHSCSCFGERTQRCAPSMDLFLRPTTFGDSAYPLRVSLVRRSVDGAIVNIPNNLPIIRSNKITMQSPPEDGTMGFFFQMEKPGFNLKPIYGGKLRFRLEYRTLREDIIRQKQYLPTVEIETRKFGRVWTIASFNQEKNLYEVTFAEDYWYGWRDSSNVPLLGDREMLLRAIITADGIVIGMTSLKNKMSDITVELVGLDVAERMEPFVAKERGYLPAPLESCECELGNANLGSNCEGCRNSSIIPRISVSSSKPDFLCDICKPNVCSGCNPGEYKYNFIDNILHETCQAGLQILTKPRTIVVHEGEKVTFPCELRSFGPKAPLHTWKKVSTVDNSVQPVDSRRVSLNRVALDSTTTRVDLHIPRVQLSDEGFYKCVAASAFSNISEDFYLKVAAKPPRFRVDITVESVNHENGTITYRGKLNEGKTINDLNIKFSDDNGMPLPSRVTQVDPDGNFQVQVDIPSKPLPLEINYEVISTSPVEPYFESGRVPSTKSEPGKEYQYESIKLDRDYLQLDFLDMGKLKVLNPQNIPLQVKWLKVPSTSDSLPQGSAQTGTDLTIFAATEEHRGNYVAEIVNPDTGEVVKRLPAEVEVLPMLPRNGTVLLPNNESAIHVNIRLPPTQYCPNRPWMLKNKWNDTTRDVTHLANVQPNGEVIVLTVNNPMTDTLIMTCEAVPQTSSRGRVELHLEPRKEIPKGNIILRLRISPTDEKTVYYNENDNISVTCVAEDSLIGQLRPEIPLSWKLWEQSDKDVSVDLRLFARNIEKEPGRLELVSMLGERLTALRGICVGKAPEGTVQSTEFTLQARHGPTIKLVSNLNPITPDGTIDIRRGRPLNLSCIVESQPPSDPPIKWFLRLPEFQTDVPQPRITIALTNDLFLIRGFTIEPLNEWNSLFLAKQFMQTNLGGDIICQGTANGRTVNASVKTNLLPERTEVIVTGIKADSTQNVIEGGGLNLSCTIIDRNTQKELSPAKYMWTFLNAGREKFDIMELASNVTYLEDTVYFTGFRWLPNNYFYGYCSATVDNYDDDSDTFSITIHKKPQIVSINVTKRHLYPQDDEGPIKWDESGKGYYEYSFTKTFYLQCEASIFNATDYTVRWNKCADPDCVNFTETNSDVLRFMGNFTNIMDKGLYRCVATAIVYDFPKVTRFIEMQLNRKAPPRLVRVDHVNTEVGRTIVLRCNERNADPTATLDWLYKPVGAVSYSVIPVEAEKVVVDEGRILELRINATLKSHSGEYKCTARNVIGYDERVAHVNIVEKWNKRFTSIL